ncbi:4-hydroxy-tetrahydrodipicolinate synthase [Allocatelliglobosispora scoriae]|uniref:4-hydroxy-tetrahydrodipicolinate synthase n=1 Tax=Allocatelliglobosispora scoriae TaxID=643052 RepID=A0A841C6B0_9ACTN|nr:dihydrodipicolinate synthase family protein [Allocatelliglobosispora scoriae]MBB5874470.1 4-hydroxy-tetrahydrodipicolinate synthase [Allocatelliglobosispora scoriae]
MTRSTDVRGLIPVLATPFLADGDLDLPSLARLMEFQVASGVDGVATFGFASEGFTLTAAERAQILRTIVDVAGPDLPIVAGVGATGTRDAIDQTRAAAANGASVAMLLPPYMVKPSPAQMVDFYGAVAAAGGLPIMVQDAPGPTGVNMPTSLLIELSKIDGVDSVKVETQPTAPKVAAVHDGTTDDFLTLGGQNALFLLEEYARGAVGTMPACEFPDLLVPVLRQWAAGEAAAARAAFARLLPLIRFGLQPGIAWSIHKHVLVRRGIIATATVRPPAVDADAASLAWLDDILADLGLV